MMIRRSTNIDWRLLFARRRREPNRLAELISQQTQFAHAIRKERARCERRSVVSEFALVSLNANWDQDPGKSQTLLCQIIDRLRITDELGWYDHRVTVLLPETDRDGAIHVANWIQELGRELKLKVDTDICLYPWDDQWARGSRWLEQDSDSPVTTDKQPSTPTPEGTSITPEHGPISTAPQTSIAERPRSRTSPVAMNQSLRKHEVLAIDSMPTPWWKRTIDLTGAIAGLTLLSPLLVAAAIAIRWDSRGQILFTQLREGKDGRIFRMYKFRTMRPDAESLQNQLRTKNEQDGPAFKMEDDPRVTQVGKFLRKSCIDELPQLLNVLKGDMSLVGPRPLPVSESTACQLWHRRRLSVLPGLTCIWQVSGGRQVSFDQWMRMDLEYARRQSLWLDTRLLWQTLRLVLRQRGSV